MLKNRRQKTSYMKKSDENEVFEFDYAHREQNAQKQIAPEHFFIYNKLNGGEGNSNMEGQSNQTV